MIALTTRQPLLERLGLRYFASLSDGLPPATADDAIHTFNERERAELHRIVRGCGTRAGIAGALSGLCSAGAELWLAPQIQATATTSLGKTAVFWSVVGATTVVAAALEIAFLYWDALRSVHALARAAGVDPAAERAGLGVAMARAALELPSPPDPVLGVDPRRELSRWKIIFVTLVYKTKIGVTNFLLKALVRRLLGRAALRSYVPLVAIPVTAAWNAWVSGRVLRQARLRVMGPSAAREFVTQVFASAPQDLPEAARIIALRAVAGCVVRTREMHPNLAALLREVHARVGDVPPGAKLDDWQAALNEMPQLEPADQHRTLQLATIACIIDGRLSPREIELLGALHSACGQALDRGALRKLYSDFSAGRAVAPEGLACTRRSRDGMPAAGC